MYRANQGGGRAAALLKGEGRAAGRRRGHKATGEAQRSWYSPTGEEGTQQRVWWHSRGIKRDQEGLRQNQRAKGTACQIRRGYRVSWWLRWLGGWLAG